MDGWIDVVVVGWLDDFIRDSFIRDQTIRVLVLVVCVTSMGSGRPKNKNDSERTNDCTTARLHDCTNERLTYG